MPPPVRSFRLVAMSLATHFGIGIHLAFFPIFLSGRGFDAATIGTLLALPPLIRIVASPLITGLADRGYAPAVILMASHGVFGLAYFSMIAVDGFWPLALLIGLGGIVQATLVPLSDVLLTREIARDRRLRYGVIRAWGSVSFMAGTLCGGLIATWFGSDAIVVGIGVSAAVAVAVMSIQPRTLDVAPTLAAGGGIGPAQPVAVVALVFVGIGLVHSSHAAVNSFGSLHWKAQGYSAEFTGILWSMSLLAEIALFFFWRMLPDTLPRALLLMSTGAFVAALRWLVMLSDPGPIVTALAQMMHAGSFGLTHLGGVAAINMLARQGARSRAQGIAVSVVGVCVSCSIYLAGRLFDGTGTRAFAAMIPIALTAPALFALAWRLSRR